MAKIDEIRIELTDGGIETYKWPHDASFPCAPLNDAFNFFDSDGVLHIYNWQHIKTITKYPIPDAPSCEREEGVEDGKGLH